MHKSVLVLVCVLLLVVGAYATRAPTKAPSKAPTTATSKAPTTAASSGGCTGKVKLLVPLYVYPGAAWDTVIAGASQVSTVAIINPNSGPINPPDSSYVSYMTKMHNAGVVMVGYVHTSYGARSQADVEADINIYASEYPLLQGIFLDEAAADASHVSYYTALYSYITSMPGWTYDIINPGVVPTSGYVAAASQIVSFENVGSSVTSAAKPSFASCSNEYQFAAIVNTVTSGSMESIVDNLFSKNYFGYIYLTDGSESCCAYNSLSSYYPSLVSYIASKQ